MNGIKFNSDQNGNQYNDNNNYIGLLNNHTTLFPTNYNNTNLLNFEHISDNINEVNVGPLLKQLQCVIGELVESESVYLKSLCDIEEGYLLRLKTNQSVDQQFLDVVFHKISDLRVFHAQLHSDLYLNRENFIQLGRVFLVNAKHFEELYVDFCLNYPKTIRLLEEAQKSRTDTWICLNNCQSELQHQLPLATYLLKPVQRILKYQLFLQECVKHLSQITTELSNSKSSVPSRDLSISNTVGLSESNNDQNNDLLLEFFNHSIYTLRQALERMIQVADHINERKRYRELLDQLRITRLDVDNWGDLVLHDHFRIPGKKGLRLVLLFQCALILCKYTPPTSSSGISLSTSQSITINDYWSNTTKTMKSRGGSDRISGNSSHMVSNVRSIEIREVISCANLMLVECIDKDPLAFHILPFDNPKAQRTLQATNLEIKRLWCHEIKRLILENYDAAIPERAKQIVLNMDDLTYGPPIKDISDLPMSLCNLQQVGKNDFEEDCLNQNCSNDRVHRKSDTALPGLRSFLNRQTNKHSIYSNSIHTPNLSLNNNINECRIPLLENGCMLNGKKNVIGDKVLPCDDDINNSTDRHLDSLLHEAWEEIWAKHQHSPVKTTFANGQSDSLENGNFHHYHQDNYKLDTEDVYSSGSIVTTKANNDADFRCIAVEINEEKFGLLSPVTVPTCTVNENKKYSVSSLSKLNTDSLNCVNNSDNYKFSIPTSSSPSSQHLLHYSSSPNFSICQRSSPTLLSNKSVHSHNRTTSVYIDCPNTSYYDVITFGRTYEQYIAKARAMVALSPKDLDEIFNPLRELPFTNREHQLSHSSLHYHNQDDILSSNIINVTTTHCSTVPLILNTNINSMKQLSDTNSTTMIKNRNCLTSDLKLSLTNLTSSIEENNGNDKSNDYCSSSGASSPRHLVSCIAVTHNRNGLNSNLVTKNITVVPSNTTATPAVTMDSRVSAARSNSLSSGFRTSESKNNVDLVDNLDRGRRRSNLDSIDRTINRQNSHIHINTRSPLGSPKRSQSHVFVSNGRLNKSGVSKPPRFVSYKSPLESVGKSLKANHNQSMDHDKQSTRNMTNNISSSSLLCNNSSKEVNSDDVLNKRGRRKSRAPAPPIKLLENTAETTTMFMTSTTTTATATNTTTTTLKAPLAVSECGKEFEDNDDDKCLESVYQGRARAVKTSLSAKSIKSNIPCLTTSQHIVSTSFRNTINTVNGSNTEKPVKPPRKLNNNTSSSTEALHKSEKSICSRYYSPTLKSLHNPSISQHKFPHDIPSQHRGIVKNMISKFQQP
ncbi:unnamed protein product [Schistosoma haematobium]|nr:unnamed protein product [Schistosoma haematobium]CAH8432743.1 unnamed protein product [Schistosoma haematobium]